MRPERRYAITTHAVDRFQQRVTDIDRAAARSAIHALATGGKRRTRPRHWMRSHRISEPGTVYIYHPDFPNIGLVSHNDTIVTVMERRSSRQWHVNNEGDRHKGRRPARRPTAHSQDKRFDHRPWVDRNRTYKEEQ